jgi:predicted RNA-binding Zn ribbon-like protein
MSGMSQAGDSREPGGREAAPSAELHLLQDFVNTNDIESERDALGTPGRLQEWLARRGLADASQAIDEPGWRGALAIREGLRALGQANNGEPLDLARVQALNRAATAYPVLVGVDGDDWSLRPAQRGVDGFLGTILATLARSVADGSWPRVKACRSDTCRWLFYDHSRNRSGTWCTMAICGSRMKSRAYRSRRRAEGA